MEQTAFGRHFFHEDRCRRIPVAGDNWDRIQFNRETHLRWIGYCDWRGVPEIQSRDLPHHRIGKGMANAGENDVNVGKVNDYLVCDACRTSAHSRLHWLEFPNVGGDKLPISNLRHRRRQDIEVRPQSRPPRSRNSGWRHWVQYAWLPVCEKCDTKQKRLHPRGHDGCVCYQRRYLNNWLCQRCDAENLREYIEVTNELRREHNMQTHAILRGSNDGGGGGGAGLKPNQRPNKRQPRCPCGALPVLRRKNTTMDPAQMVKRCGQCLGFIVPKEFDPPGKPTRVMKRRRADRSPDRGLQMLDERGRTVDQPIFV